MKKLFLTIFGIALLMKGAADPVIFNGAYAFSAVEGMFIIQYLPDLRRPILAINQGDVVYCVDLDHMDRGTLDRMLPAAEPAD